MASVITRLVGIAILLVCAAGSQSFEVASVKPSIAGPNGRLPMRIAFEPGGQRFTAIDAPLKNLIMLAYDLTDLQISGGPAWTTSDGFDIEAKAEHPSSREEMRKVLQDLLAKRFALIAHTDSKTMRILALAPAKKS